MAKGVADKQLKAFMVGFSRLCRRHGLRMVMDTSMLVMRASLPKGEYDYEVLARDLDGDCLCHIGDWIKS